MRKPSTLALLLALALLAAHGPVLVGARTWSDPGYVTEVVPARAAAVDAIADGRLPGWWDRAGLGAPLAAEPTHGAMYPGWWAAAVAPGHAPWLLDVIAVLHVLWGALGVALLARRLGADDLGALVAGSWFAVSDVATGAIVGGAIAAVAHLPWAAWAGDVIARAEGPRTRRGGALALAAALAAMLAAGRWAIAADGVLVAAAMVIARARVRRAGAAGAVAAACGLALALAAAAWLPALLHVTGDVARGGGGGTASPWVLVEMIVPHARSLGAGGAGGVFIGAAALAFAIAAVASGGDGARIVGGAALVFALAAAGRLGADPADHAAAAAVLACALAGTGFARLAARRPEVRTTRAVLISGGALVVLLVALMIARPVLAHRLDTGDLDAAVARVDGVLAHGAIAIVVALAALGLLVAANRRPWPAAIPAAAVMVLGHMVIVGRLAHPSSPRDELESAPSLLRAASRSAVRASVREAGLPPRLYRPDVMAGVVDTAPDPALAAWQSLAAATATRFGYAAVRYQVPGRQPAEDLLWRTSASSGGRLFDRFAIELALVPATVASATGMNVVGERGEWALVETGARRPRAFLAPGWRWFADDAEAARAMFPLAQAPALPLGVVARLGTGDDVSPELGDAPVPCRVRGESPERVVVHCDDAPAGMIVLLDAWAPGWSVTVDGGAAPLERVEVAARGVAVPAGAHDAVFTYDAPGAAAGRYITLLGIFGSMILVVTLIRSRPDA